MIKDVSVKMIEYYGNDIKRINHFLKVYSFAKIIGENEGLDKKTQEILEIAALTHDIGIKISEEKYNSSAGKYQEIEGPSEAEKMLSKLGINYDIIKRVCYIIGHHHTYDNIDGMDYQIVVEADFLVNLYEDNCSDNAIEKAYNNIFKTQTGKSILKKIYFKEK